MCGKETLLIAVSGSVQNVLIYRLLFHNSCFIYNLRFLSAMVVLIISSPSDFWNMGEILLYFFQLFRKINNASAEAG